MLAPEQEPHAGPGALSGRFEGGPFLVRSTLQRQSDTVNRLVPKADDEIAVVEWYEAIRRRPGIR